MNKNIFSPKGEIDQSSFILYYILLVVLYIIFGLFLFTIILKNHYSLIYVGIPLFIIKILIAFNYKKRILQICKNLPVSVILAVVLTFDTDLIPLLHQPNNSQNPAIFALLAIIFTLCIQPAIVALIPPKD